MARPPTPIGTNGKITTKRLTKDRCQAEGYFRMADGTSKRVLRTGRTLTDAENRLKIAFTELGNEVRGAEITGETRMRRVAEMWLAELEHDEKLGTVSHGTVRNYRGWLNNWIVPRIGELQVRELSVKGCERVIEHVQDKTGFGTASKVKVVLGLVCGYAVRHGALDANPVRSSKRLARGDEEQKEVRALEPGERADLLQKLTALAAVKSVDSKGRSLGARAKVWTDLPDLAEAFLSTGGRLGEVLALQPEDVDPVERTVAMDHHVVRITGQGLVRKAKRKGSKGGLLLRVPQWSVAMWRRRKLASGGGTLFATAAGGLLDPSNVGHRLREAFDACGYDWLTSHALGRKTVAAVLDDAGLSVTEIADQLGNTPAVAEKHYRRRRKANTKQAEALEGMFNEAEGAG